LGKGHRKIKPDNHQMTLYQYGSLQVHPSNLPRCYGDYGHPSNEYLSKIQVERSSWTCSDVCSHAFYCKQELLRSEERMKDRIS